MTEQRSHCLHSGATIMADGLSSLRHTDEDKIEQQTTACPFAMLTGICKLQGHSWRSSETYRCFVLNHMPGTLLASTLGCYRKGSAGAPLRPKGAFCQSKCPACAPALQGVCTSVCPCSCPSPGAALSIPPASCRHMTVQVESFSLSNPLASYRNRATFAAPAWKQLNHALS